MTQIGRYLPRLAEAEIPGQLRHLSRALVSLRRSFAFVDGEAAALVFRHKVFSFLQAEGLLSAERTGLLLSWRHSGFSVHTTVTVPPDDRDGLERLARYMLRAPVSLERLSFDAASDRVAYARRPGRGHDPIADDRLTDPWELLARVLLHIPEARRHVIRYNGADSKIGTTSAMIGYHYWVTTGYHARLT